MLQSAIHSRCDEIMVVVPCFNEATRLKPQAFSDFLDRTTNVTLIFVDDGSTDNTPLVLERLRQQHPRQVSTLRLSANVGKGEAVRRGMNVALRKQPAVVGYWDADLATPLDAIPRFMDVLTARPDIELVIGSRVSLLGRYIERSPVRHFAGRVFATAASIVLRLPVYDTQCGAKLFRATRGVRQLLSQPFRARWVFDVEILARMILQLRHAGQTLVQPLIYEYPLEEWHDVHGSRLKLRDFVVAAIDLLAIHRQYRRLSVQPLSDQHANGQSPSTDVPQRRAA